jgi:pyridoxal/pyridoxine/pyridoxamine kinase
MNLQQSLSLIAIGLAGLKATGKIDPVIMGYIETADNAINAALAAVEKAKQGVDPSLLKPIDPVK